MAIAKESVGLQNSKPSEKVIRMSSSSLPDDIPVAQRQAQANPVQPSTHRRLIYAGFAAIALVALASGGLVSWQVWQLSQADEGAIAAADLSPNSDEGVRPSPKGETLLNHYAYTEAPTRELEVVESGIKLRHAAARAYRDMVAAARQSGVELVLISGFRSLSDQEYLYFNIKAERNQNAQERAKVSAPPGYSEHHTGYAIDVGDARVPAADLRQDFEQTPAFRWLKTNAARYGFELSFPRDNTQGVSYEPWHWRYVGDIDSLKTFYKARGK